MSNVCAVFPRKSIMKSMLILLPLCFTGIVARQLSNTQPKERPAANNYYAKEGYCPDNWVAFGDDCYWFASNDSRMMYFQALSHCKALDAHLVTVPTEKQQKFLVSRLSDATTNLWIGLDRHPNGTWTWLDGNAVDYTNWIIGQPRPNGEECSEILTGTIHVGRWNQVRCNAKRMHVCQKRRDKSLPAPTATPQVSRCELAYPGSFEYRSSCYRMGSYQDWDSAASTCQGQGGHLVSIRDAFEDAFLSVKFNFRGGLFWTGLHDAKATGRFTWASGWPVHYTSWAPLQPSASGGSGSCCVASDLTTGLWSVQPCDRHLSFLCEFNTEDPPEVDHHEGSCPEHAKNWIDVGTPYCYWLETERVVSFNESDATCRAKNSTLASFHSKDQMHRLLPYIRKSKHQLWIGLVSAHNDSYEWLDGSPLDYEHWKQGEPSSVDENCVEIRHFDALWNDAHCHRKNGFICAVEKKSQADDVEGAAATQAAKPSAGVCVVIALACLLVLVAAGFAIHQFYRYTQRKQSNGLTSFENTVYIDPPVYNPMEEREGSAIVE